MALYDLKQEDIADVLALISAASLTITANNARRVAQLQGVFANAKPSARVEELEARCDAYEKEVRECLRARDTALLEAGIAKRAVDALDLCARGECDPSTCASTRHQH